MMGTGAHFTHRIFASSVDNFLSKNCRKSFFPLLKIFKPRNKKNFLLNISLAEQRAKVGGEKNNFYIFVKITFGSSTKLGANRFNPNSYYKSSKNIFLNPILRNNMKNPYVRGKTLILRF